MPKSNNPRIADEGKPYRWKKGQSGNLSGRPKSKTLSDAYRNKLQELVPNDPEGRSWAELIAEAQVRDAVRGNVQAAREIADRTEGRARQGIEFEDKTLANAFERMTNEELEAYAHDGTLPAWFPRSTAANSVGGLNGTADDLLE